MSRRPGITPLGTPGTGWGWENGITDSAIPRESLLCHLGRAQPRQPWGLCAPEPQGTGLEQTLANSPQARGSQSVTCFHR